MDENKPRLPKVNVNQDVIDKILKTPMATPIQRATSQHNILEQIKSEVVAEQTKKESRERIMLWSAVLAAVFGFIGVVIAVWALLLQLR